MADSKKKQLLRFLIPGIIVTATACGLAFGFFRAISDSLKWKESMKESVINPSFSAPNPALAKAIPDFSLPDRYHNPVRLSDFASVDTLVVNIWFTGCTVCEQELPSLVEMDRRLGDTSKVALLTITTDETWEDTARLFPKGTRLRILFDPEQKVTKDIFGTVRYPETFILDKERRIRARFDGRREWHLDEMISFITSFE
jgi:cytochrome c biogenesis protein CcmG, thiol:disulfide interchange protein DsbE